MLTGENENTDAKSHCRIDSAVDDDVTSSVSSNDPSVVLDDKTLVFGKSPHKFDSRRLAPSLEMAIPTFGACKPIDGLNAGDVVIALRALLSC